MNITIYACLFSFKRRSLNLSLPDNNGGWLYPKPLSTVLFLSLFLSVLLPEAHAGMVCGQIIGTHEDMTSGTTMLENSEGERIRIMVDAQGRYRISLPPGDYRVTYQSRRSRTVYEGWLSSSPNSARQDVKMVPTK